MLKFAAACLVAGCSFAVLAAQSSPVSSSASPRAGSGLILPAVEGDPTRPATAHLSLATSSTAAGARATLVVDVTPRAEFHIYAPEVKGYKPAALKVIQQEGMTAAAPAFPKPELMFFEEANDKVPVYAKPFRVTEQVTLDAARLAELKAGKPLTVVGAFEYQACDNRVCYKPATVPVQWTIAATEAGSK